MPDGSLCTASVEQIFPRDGVQRNCFELALYIMTASPIASVRVFETALPTLSVRDRAIIVLNHHRFWGYASGPSSSGNTLPSSIHGHAARRSALPRERFSPLTHRRHGSVRSTAPTDPIKPAYTLDRRTHELRDTWLDAPGHLVRKRRFLRRDPLVMALSGGSAELPMALKKAAAPCRPSRCPRYAQHHSCRYDDCVY